jgi:hypothetical protein
MRKGHGQQAGRKSPGARFVSTGEAEKTLGLSAATIRNYAKPGKIDYMLTEGSKYRFDVEGYLARNVKKAGASAPSP